MKREQNPHRAVKLLGYTAALSLAGWALLGCQEDVTLAEQEPVGSTPTPLEIASLEICGVIPMQKVSIEAIAPFSDGAVSLAGELNDDTFENTVFGKGESNETVLTADPDGPNGGFIAKYGTDRQLLWAVGGMDRVQDLTADADGGVTAIVPTSSAGDFRALEVWKLNSDGTEAWTLTIERGDMAEITPEGDIVAIGSFSDTVTLGEGEDAVSLENTAGESYVSYVAAYESDRTLAWVVTLDNLYIANDLAVGADGIAVVDNSGTLVYLNTAGEELWRRQADDNGAVDQDLMMVGSFIDYGSTTVKIASDGSVLWGGEFEVSAIFSDNADNVIALSAPYEFDDYGGATLYIHPFSAHYTQDGELLSATDNIGFQSMLIGGDTLLTLDPRPRSTAAFPDYTTLLDADDQGRLYANAIFAHMDLDGELEDIREVSFGTHARYWFHEVVSPADDYTTWISTTLAEGLAGESYPIYDNIGSALVQVCAPPSE